MGGRALGSMGDLDELEAFLREVEQSGPEEEDKINAKPPENIVKLLRDVNNELAEAQREVLQLRDENMSLQERQKSAGIENGDDMDRDTEIAELHRVATGHEKYSIELQRKLEEARGEVHELKQELLKLPNKKKDGPKGPAKRGALAMGSKTLQCELIGGETLELSDTSQPGHCHVSKISLAHIIEVKMTGKPKTAFSVATAGGAYIMSATTEAEAKSWVRAIQVSMKVAMSKK